MATYDDMKLKSWSGKDHNGKEFRDFFMEFPGSRHAQLFFTVWSAEKNDHHYTVLNPEGDGFKVFAVIMKNSDRHPNGQPKIGRSKPEVFKTYEEAKARYDELIALFMKTQERGWQSPVAEAKVSENATVASC